MDYTAVLPQTAGGVKLAERLDVKRGKSAAGRRMGEAWLLLA